MTGLPLQTSEAQTGVILDLDGTLAPIVARPDLAEVPAETLNLLGDLASRFAVVAVVTGRTAADAARLVPISGVELVPLYGLSDVVPVSEEILARVRREADRVPGVTVEPKGGTVAIHARAAPDPAAAMQRLEPELRAIGAENGLSMIRGKLVWELVPSGRSRKGGAVRRLIREHGLGGVIYAGDDEADLAAFRALDRGADAGLAVHRVAVRGNETPGALLADADVVVDGPDGLVALLRSL
jgi:trehalose 6-phosphate phosphatase